MGCGGEGGSGGVSGLSTRAPSPPPPPPPPLFMASLSERLREMRSAPPWTSGRRPTSCRCRRSVVWDWGEVGAEVRGGVVFFCGEIASRQQQPEPSVHCSDRVARRAVAPARTYLQDRIGVVGVVQHTLGPLHCLPRADARINITITDGVGARTSLQQILAKRLLWSRGGPLVSSSNTDLPSLVGQWRAVWRAALWRVDAWRHSGEHRGRGRRGGRVCREEKESGGETR